MVCLLHLHLPPLSILLLLRAVIVLGQCSFELMDEQNSLRLRPRLHLHPPRSRRRSEPLRDGGGALVADPICREDSDQCDEYVGGAE